MANKEERYLEQIAKELHVMNKVLERMVQAPIFKKEDTLTPEDIEAYIEAYRDDSPQKKHVL